MSTMVRCLLWLPRRARDALLARRVGLHRAAPR
jgi:hypothetical protein